MDFRKSGRFCTGKCVKFSYIYIKNAINSAMFGDVDDSTRHFFHYMPKTVGFIFGHLSCCRLPKIPNTIGHVLHLLIRAEIICSEVTGISR